ncbi:MAG: PilW family protein [Anaerocolumna sp.]
MNELNNKGLNNKGLTLVELLVAMAIATIVICSITYFMATSSKSYSKANDEATLQIEAQTILNQLNELIIEAYNVKMNESTNTVTIYSKDLNYYIKLQDQKLLLNKKKSNVVIEDTDNWILFGEYVTEFMVKDTGENNDNSSILISFTLNKNEASYQVTNGLVALRNKIKVITD